MCIWVPGTEINNSPVVSNKVKGFGNFDVVLCECQFVGTVFNIYNIDMNCKIAMQQLGFKSMIVFTSSHEFISLAP